MARHEKTPLKDLHGRSVASIGFDERVRGSRHIFFKAGIEELIHVQRSGSKAKPYQVRQVRAVIARYGMGDLE